MLVFAVVQSTLLCRHRFCMNCSCVLVHGQSFKVQGQRWEQGMYEEREQKGSKTKLTLSPPEEGRLQPQQHSQMLRGLQQKHQLMVWEQHEQMVLQHSHVACTYSHHLLSNPLPLFSFLVTNYYVLTFCFYIASTPSMVNLGLCYKNLWFFRITDFLQLWEERQALSFIYIYIYNLMYKNLLPL